MKNKLININEPTGPGEYWYEDEGGGPTLYKCELVGNELKCGPKITGHRFHLDTLRTESSKWSKVI